jgi:hypothetical protein
MLGRIFCGKPVATFPENALLRALLCRIAKADAAAA